MVATAETTKARPRRRDERLSPGERAARGKALRADAPRSSHADWVPVSGRPDPIALLEEQAATRVKELVPIRYGRMVASPFAFYRGAAYVMASDLANTPQTGLRAQLCGDAHLSNFGGFASPERDLLFDLNDFDETLPGPWEWDVKRLLASLEVAARENGFTPKQRHSIVADAAGQYREVMRRFASMNTLDVWYARIDEGLINEVLRPHAKRRQAEQFDKLLAKARRKDSSRAFEKLATSVNSGVHIVADPPLIVPVEDLLGDDDAERLEDAMKRMFASYRRTLPADRRKLLDRYRFVDMARKVVGVGSVGTRAWVILLLGRDDDDPLFLQAKEAQHSVLEPFCDNGEHRNQGQRVVEGQRLMQAASDIMLGWLRATDTDNGEPRDFYLRQLWDWKTSADITTMVPRGMNLYGRLCASTLARAHARSGDSIAIASYLGRGDAFDRAMVAFADAYADQNELDHKALVDAIESGRLKAQTGL
ncbi:MAG: DUF2252 domain-containing protein [Thermoleophilaceae bacterium]